MALTRYIVSLDSAVAVDDAGLERHLRESGFTIVNRLQTLGMLVGEAEPDHVPRIRAVKGVAAVEVDRTIRGAGC